MTSTNTLAEIDPSLLPERALIDTNVLIRALGQRTDNDAAACRGFFEAMIKADRRVLIAAPSFAEFLNGSDDDKYMRTRNPVVVAFDDRASHLLGSRLPERVVRSELALADGSTTPIAYLKFDAMIAACAARHRADCVVALDKQLRRTARQLGVAAKHPTEFFAKQTLIAPVIASVIPPPDKKAPPSKKDLEPPASRPPPEKT